MTPLKCNPPPQPDPFRPNVDKKSKPGFVIMSVGDWARVGGLVYALRNRDVAMSACLESR